MQRKKEWIPNEPLAQEGHETQLQGALDGRDSFDDDLAPPESNRQEFINEPYSPAFNPFRAQITPPIPIDLQEYLGYQPQLQENNQLMREEEGLDYLEVVPQGEAQHIEIDELMNAEENDQETNYQEGIPNNEVRQQHPQEPEREVITRCRKDEKTEVQQIHQQVLGQHPVKKLPVIMTKFIKQRVEINDQDLLRRKQHTKTDSQNLLRRWRRPQIEEIYDEGVFRNQIDTRYREKEYTMFSKLAGAEKDAAIYMHKECLMILFKSFKQQAFDFVQGNNENLGNITNQYAHIEFGRLGQRLEELYPGELGSLLYKVYNPN